ncbi:peroxin 8 [Coniella lustricola]|uniref:Peroxin 8 n=1 Tax=Coniella lustricola TaxID=2025994 RepID=A0A2T3AEP1_9PEZI|nr:peroxin 8 [Coniella lustricola]
MPADSLLNQVLADYQTRVHDERQRERLLGTTLTLLTELTNPLNLSLLTSQLLTAPAIWHHDLSSAGLDPLESICQRVLSVFNTAAIHVRRAEIENEDRRLALGFGIRTSSPTGGGLTCDEWAKAVVKGADERSSRWQHVLVLAGILMGFEGDGKRGLPSSMRRNLESAVVTAANLALKSLDKEPRLARSAVVLALNWAFPLLSDLSKEDFHCDALLSVALQSLLGADGFQGGLFLGLVGSDVKQIGSLLEWPEATGTYAAIQRLASRPLVQSAGPLANLISFAVSRTRDHRIVLQAQDDLVSFTKSLLNHWRHLQFSRIDSADEAVFLTEGTFQVTYKTLWRILTNILFAVIAVMRAVTARSLLDPHLKRDSVAPLVAAKTLRVYRNLSFISSRGNNSFQVYLFSYLTSIDILARYPEPTVAFLKETLPPAASSIPTHALDRILDLFYLNTAEHLPLHISPDACEELIIQPAITYLSGNAPHSKRVVELFEAAHSAVLSVLCCPQNGPIAIKMAPFYADTLLEFFPSHISPRQFRLAFSTLMQILSPPFPVSGTQPDLGETLLEMVRLRIPFARHELLPAAPEQDSSPSEPMSEQSALVLTLIDALPLLALNIVEAWMTVVGSCVHEITDPFLKEAAKQRFWELLGSGEMDVERAAIGVAWWGTKGGRELVLFGPKGQPAQDPFVMSGALVDETVPSKL